MKLVDMLRSNLRYGVAAAIRLTTTFNENATQKEMVAASELLGLNASTVLIQFNQARREDAEIERLCS